MRREEGEGGEVREREGEGEGEKGMWKMNRGREEARASHVEDNNCCILQQFPQTTALHVLPEAHDKIILNVYVLCTLYSKYNSA